MKLQGNRTLRLTVGIVLALIFAALLTRTTAHGNAGLPTILLLGRGDAAGETFAREFEAAFKARHPLLARQVRLQALRLPGDDEGYVRELRKAAQARPLLFVARNAFQARLVHRHASDVDLLFTSYVDPREDGIVTDLAQHSERATGLWIADQLDAKRLEVLLDAYPSMQRAGLIGDKNWHRDADALRDELQAIAKAHGRTLRIERADTVEEAIARVDAPQARDVQAWCLPRTPLSVDGRLAAHLAGQGRAVMMAHTPDIYGSAHLSYAADKSFVMPALADLAARIVRGEAANAIPVQTPQRYQLAVRLTQDERLPVLNPDIVRRADIVVRP